MKTLPANVAVRFVAWDAQGIYDVCEFQSRADFRRYARTYLNFGEQVIDRRLEVLKWEATDDRCSLTGAKLKTGVPSGCRIEQPVIELEGVGIVSLDRFWDTLVECAAQFV